MSAEQPKSKVRISFEKNIQAQQWPAAFTDFNGLNMYEMLRAYRDLALGVRPAFSNAVAFLAVVTLGAASVDRMKWAIKTVDDGQMPDIDPPPGDIRATGQEEDCRDFLAPVPHRLAPFLFSKLQSQYPAGDAAHAKSIIGGKADADWITNTCAMRISRVLNYNSAPIPGPGAGSLDVVSGADSRWYAYRQKDLQKWFTNRFGAPSITLTKPVDRRKLLNLQGFLGFDIRGWNDATGHFDLWDGKMFGTEPQATHDYFALAESISFWRVRNWEKL